MTIELSLRGVRAGYGPVEVLHGIDLDVPTGALTALVGANGAGKTTLLTLLAGLLPLRAGSITWCGRRMTGMPADQRARAGLALVPERRGVFGALTVRDNLEVFAGHGGDLSPAFAAFPVLEQRLEQLAGGLSGGEQQMLAVSRALLSRPKVLMVDEISFGLAPRVTRQLFDVVADLARNGTTVVLIDQHLGEVLKLADVVYVLARGEIAFAGEPAELQGRQIPSYAATTVQAE
jgi:branched-chain amino acid transport system ATP-binding protein